MKSKIDLSGISPFEMQTKLLDFDPLEVKPYATEMGPVDIEHLKAKPWRMHPFKKENWGNRLHAIAPYIGRMKPAIAHWLIRMSSKKGELVLDPFCGIGTVPLEADLLGRRAIGLDLNDYAVLVSKAKFDRRPLGDNLDFLNNVYLNSESIDLSVVPDYVKQFYHPNTLREIISLRNILLSEKREFLLGCLIGICHGHRPQYLSAWTGYIIPFPPKTKPDYRAVIPRMVAKASRMYQSGFPMQTNAIITKADSRIMTVPDNSVDLVISSPPYFDTIDYASTNRLRLAIMGISEVGVSLMKKDLIQQEKSYLESMRVVGTRLNKIMKNSSLCIFVLGDLHKGKRDRNTASEVSSVYKELGFEELAVIEDEIPLDHRIANKWKGESLGKSRPKLDRILIMKLKK